MLIGVPKEIKTHEYRVGLVPGSVRELVHHGHQMLVEAGAGTAGELKKVRTGSGLGLFVRSMVGLDREAAKRAFDGFLSGKTLTANQIHFVNLVIDYLTQSGWMSPGQLYESPFTEFSPRGVEGVFDPEQVAKLVAVLDKVRMSACT